MFKSHVLNSEATVLFTLGLNLKVSLHFMFKGLTKTRAISTSLSNILINLIHFREHNYYECLTSMNVSPL